MSIVCTAHASHIQPDKFKPDRIFIETSYVSICISISTLLLIHSRSSISGSAFPATLAFQIRELERETNGELKLDAIVTVIDAENFTGYEDSSPTARMQASYTDLILIVSPFAVPAICNDNV